MTEPTWTFMPPSLDWADAPLPEPGERVWVVDDWATDRSAPVIGVWGDGWYLDDGSDECVITAWTPLTDERPTMPEHPTCGAVYPRRPGQEPCRKWRDHHLGPDSDWKRDYHSNGLLKWRVDGADMPSVQGGGS